MQYRKRFVKILTTAILGAIAMGVIDNPSQAETLVLSAPNKSERYYKEKYQAILDFQLNYAKQISGKDNVVILTDKAGYKYFSQHLPENMLLQKPVMDIWVRDFSPVAHDSNVQFKYTSYAGGGRIQANAIQGSFDRAVKSAGIKLRKTKYILDGGNYVGLDGKAIVTERFLEDNNLSYADGKAALKEILGVTEVAIIPSDDPGLAHSDGMVMFGDPQTLFVNRYNGSFRKEVLAELESAFPGVKIIEIPVQYSDEDFDPKFASSCGIYVNSVVTDSAIYVPQFGIGLDKKVLDIIRQNTSKKVVPIESSGVCDMGGSARCLVWQAKGDHGAKIRQAAAEG